ncbi:MAG: EamA family transporter [Ignavibacteriales bacterium]|nr:EamA family transporter [Ignavibacteriales bacterium]
MSERLKSILAYIAICTIWGSTWLVIKVGLETLTPLLSAGLRFAVAAIILFGIIKIRKIEIPWNSATAKLFFIVSLTSFSIPFALVYWGEQHVSSGLTSILFAVFPFCVAIMSVLMLPNEKLTVAKIAGIVLGFSGIVVIFSNDIQFGTERDQILGMTAIVLSAFIQAFSAVLIKKHGHDLSPFVVSFVPMTFAGIFLTIGGIAAEDLTHVQFTSTAIFSILFLAVFGSVTTFVSYFWLLKRVEVVLLSLTSFVTPIIAVILGVIILHESVSSQLFVGSSLVLTGILVANSTDVRIFLRNRFSSKE